MQEGRLDELAVLLLSCPDRSGIVADITSYIASIGANIVAAEQSDAGGDGRFYQRITFNRPGRGIDVEALTAAFAPVCETLGADWSLNCLPHRSDEPGALRTAILCSKPSHCLQDLLARWRIGDIVADVRFVISNHDDNRDIAEAMGLPYHHLPVTPATKAEQEAKVDALLDGDDVDLVVLARYMQILSPALVEKWSGKIINIHHSFLPAFPGARPYHQAMERGVKLVGATAHYATIDLDEGPIIDQDVARISHRDRIDDLLRIGRDLENRVLASAVRSHLQHRIIVHGRRTVVFN